MAAKKSTKKPKPGKSAIRREIIAIIIIAAAILVLISLFVEDAGLLGRLVNSLLLGLFGIGGFLLPVFALIYGGILLVGKADILQKSKIIMGGAVYFMLISLVHMLGPARPDDISIWQYIGQIFLYGGIRGGLFGAALSRLFALIISEIGTYILFVTVSAILIMQITGRSLFGALKWGFFSAKDSVENAKERRALRREEEEQKEQEAEYYEEEYEYNPPPVKLHNLVLDQDDRRPSVDTETPIVLAKSVSRGEQHLSSRPKSPKNLVLIQDELDDEPDLFEEPESEPEEAEFPIYVKGFVEGSEEVKVITPETVRDKQDDQNVVIAAPWDDMDAGLAESPAEYIFPPVELLRENTYQPSVSSRAQILENSKKLEETLQSFGVSARVAEVSKGPTVTRYELSPGSGVKVSKISGLADDLALNLAASGIRIEAPIPGKSVVGIEIPNKETQAVYLREVIDDDAFWTSPGKLSFAMGKDIAGNIVIADIAKMPHLLIAGATGAGKSVCINTLIASIIYKATPAEVKLLMIDPKVVELSVYNGIPHLLIPVVTDPKKASGALAWAVREMDDRYNRFAETRVRDLAGFNAYLTAEGEDNLPQIVIIIDELADLMMTCGKEVEESICRLAQKARAAGIHLIIATQRPSVDVITGLIKANVPSRLAFAVSSGTDSRTILDMVGAEKLLGKGDMLFSPVGLSKPQRIQGSFISDKEVENLVNFIKQEGSATYDEDMIEKITATADNDEASSDSDSLIEEAIAFVVEREKASTSMLQRRFRIGYNRAARMMEELVARGLVGPEDGAKPRKVLMTALQHREYLERKK